MLELTLIIGTVGYSREALLEKLAMITLIRTGV